MSIVVNCSCGKMFKAKDDMAGKKVRCPECKTVLRIGDSGQKTASKSASSSSRGASKPKIDAQAALLKYEAAQKEKQQQAEAQAAYKAEQEKLIASYDQLAGKASPKDIENKKDKTSLTETGVKKPTVTTKAADAAGTVFGNAWVKYVIIFGLLGAGAYGSYLAFGAATGALSDDMVKVTKSTNKSDQVKELYKEIRVALGKKEYTVAKKKLDEVISIDPGQIKSRNYTDNLRQLEEAMSGGKSEPKSRP